MSVAAVNLPINVPWKLMATSIDMMDARHNGGDFPAPWRSSMAIYAYEPPPEELDPALCDRRLMFLKVTCSITGIQYSDVEVDRLIDWVSKRGMKQNLLEQAREDYFACYGVILHVSVSPQGDGDVELADFPHIVDFEPKKRDLYEAATEMGEILTASKGSVQTGKSLTDTQTTETGISPKVEVPLKVATVGAEMSQKWGSTTADGSSSSTDSSRESRETHGTTTNITQMYNLLTGYHAGTNRAMFLMLPRPHNLQPTEKRTFVNGLREIEGLQEFFLVVERAAGQPGLCVEARLQTGHYSESVPAVTGPGGFEHFEATYYIDEKEVAGFGKNRPLTIAVTTTPFIGAGVELDYKKDNAGHGPVREIVRDEPKFLVNAHDWLETLERPSYRIDTDGVLHVNAKYRVHGPYIPGTANDYRFLREYVISLKRRVGSGPETVTDPEGLVIASRRISSCITRAEDGCLSGKQERLKTPVDYSDLRAPKRPGYADGIEVRRDLTRCLSRASASDRVGVRNLIETDFVARRLGAFLPPEELGRPVRLIAGGEDLADRVGDTSLRDLLEWSDAVLARRLGTDPKGARLVRARLLGLSLADDAPG